MILKILNYRGVIDNVHNSLILSFPEDIYILLYFILGLKLKEAYWIIQRFLVHYQILHLSNIAIAILDFSLMLPIKLSLFQLLR